MAYQIQLRNSTAATWTSTNPILSQGEPGVETDTGQFKIGDGVTAWNSLAYQGSTGPTQTAPYRSLGDGSDGTVTVTSGIVILTRDMYYNNLSVSGTGSIDTNNYKIFVKNILDLSGAPVGAIQNNSPNGNAASGSTGASAPTAVPSGTIAATSTGGAGGNGNTGAGSAGSGGTALTGNGGGANASGTGGAGAAAGGAAGAGIIPTVSYIDRYETNILRGIALIGGGGAGGGGGGGGGDNASAAGGGGGSGGSGGGAVVLYANAIVTSSTTSASAIQALGGMGGSGGNGATSGGATGGGGGGAGGSGGWVFIMYNQRFGPTITGMLDASSGMGGNGGNGFGAGIGGKGGSGGNAGTITTYQIPVRGTVNNTAVNFVSATTWVPQLLGSLGVGNQGGGAGASQIFKINF